MITAGAAAVAFAFTLLVWATTLLFRRAISDCHMWLYTAVFFVFLALSFLAVTEPQAF
jgi:hypothetical protein